MLYSSDIANYLLFKAQKDDHELLSNLKLQKLIYYVQGLYLAVYGKPLFQENIVAWSYGPVVVDLYHQYKIHGSSGIPADSSFDIEKIDDDTKEFIDEVYDALGQFSAIRLMEISHTDKCWKDAGIDEIISLDSMEKCLKKYLKNEKT